MNSISVMADAFNNLSVHFFRPEFYRCKISCRPADKGIPWPWEN